MPARPALPPALSTALRRGLLTAFVTSVVLAVLAVLVPATGGPAASPRTDVRQVRAEPDREPNPVTPGDFRGYGFDQCLAPTQRAMDAWLFHSPFLAVGIYISGNSRWCRDQPHLTPAWVRSQLRKGWRLLPITLGPQASCHPGFPRYDDDPRIDNRPGAAGTYRPARRQARAEADKAVAEAKRLGIVPRSTLWYDLEGFDHTRTRCRESALAFLSAWTQRLHELGYRSGVYSSAGSGIKMLDDARVRRTPGVTLPDMIWIARWDGRANTSTSYIRGDGWTPGGRVKQYQGGHDEKWGGVTINIDRNFLDLGRGSHAPSVPHCDGVRVDYTTYPPVRPARRPAAWAVRALQCLLTERGFYRGKVNGSYTDATVAAVRAWKADRGLPTTPRFLRTHWVALHAQGPVLAAKVGSAGEHVRRVQRALNAADPTLRRTVDGVYSATSRADVRAFQERAGLPATGIVNRGTWDRLRKGVR